MNSINKILTF